MFTVDQLVAHAVGDYVLQSEWMAVEKTKGTHFVIDRWQLARYVAWLKNRPWPGSSSWSECKATGFSPDTPPWMATWLVIIIDNVMHILINGLAITYIGT